MTDTETLDATATTSELAYSKESEPVEYSVLNPHELLAAEIREALKSWPDEAACALYRFAKQKCKLCYGRGVAAYLMGGERVRKPCTCVQAQLRVDQKSHLRLARKESV